MRQLFTGLLVATIITAMPMLVVGSDQEVAQRIANKLKSSGQLTDYRIAVKCQGGTVWLKGQVHDEQEAIAALKLALGTPGVESVVNELSAASGETPAPKTNEATPKTAVAKLEAASESNLAGTESESYLGGAKSESYLAGAKSESYFAGVTEVTPRADKLPASFTREAAKAVSAIDPNEQEGAASRVRHLPQADTQPVNQIPLPLDNRPATRRPVPLAYRQTAAPASPPAMASEAPQATGTPGPPLPMYTPGVGGGVAPARFDQPCLPNYAWPSYASYPNYAAVTYPKQYSPTAWPYIGPFYPYPQVPLGWRKVTLEWEDGWWMLDFKDTPSVWDPPVGRWY